MPGVLLPSNLTYTFISHSGNWSDLVLADTNCTYGIQWMWQFMGQCVMDTRGILAVVCGFVSLCTWVITGLPQIIENFRTGLPDKAISPLLLMFWTLGDLTNFVGCILTHQLILQIFISVYGVANDLILISQFIYYKIRHKMVVAYVNEGLGDGAVSLDEEFVSIDEVQHTSDSTPLLNVSAVVPRVLPVCFVGAFLFITFIGPVSKTYHLTPELSTSASSFLGVSLKSSLSDIPFLPTTTLKIGYVLGCVSSLMYLCSRIPQICQNWRRGSTEGLCLILFCLAVVGNVFYGLQIFLTSTDPMFLLRSLPWLIGTVGVILLDFVILFQFYYFSPNKSRKAPPSPVENQPV